MARVLLIDDDEMLRELMAMRLEMEGFEIVEADNGALGLEILLSESFDAVVLDMLMPVLDGMRFLQEVYEKLSDPPPIIVLSAVDMNTLNSMEGICKPARALRKPVEIDRLLDALREVNRV